MGGENRHDYFAARAMAALIIAKSNLDPDSSESMFGVFGGLGEDHPTRIMEQDGSLRTASYADMIAFDANIMAEAMMNPKNIPQAEEVTNSK